MIAMLDTSEELTVCESELGVPVEQLVTPLTRRLVRPGVMWVADNGCFKRFDGDTYLSLLRRNEVNRSRCRWVTAPDVVGSAIRTLECFEEWRHKLAGWPLALVLQDGQENIQIPWNRISAVFIGGSTAWKVSECAAQCIRAAKIMGKWAHIGRVNTPIRWETFEELGADSADGTGIAQYTHMRLAIKNGKLQEKLFSDTDSEGRSLVSGDSVGLVGAAPVLDSVRADSEGARG